MKNPAASGVSSLDRKFIVLAGPYPDLPIIQNYGHIRKR
jgi:hypothetical protein